MKTLFCSMLLVVASTGTALAEPANQGEIGYPQGSIGYDALLAGDNQRAINQILADARLSRQDPARLINLGQAYARVGRTSEAVQLFNAVIQSRDDLDLILADGSVMNSKEAARKALAKLQSRVASR